MGLRYFLEKNDVRLKTMVKLKARLQGRGQAIGQGHELEHGFGHDHRHGLEPGQELTFRYSHTNFLTLFKPTISTQIGPFYQRTISRPTITSILFIFFYCPSKKASTSSTGYNLKLLFAKASNLLDTVTL